MFHFKAVAFYGADDADRAVPQVSFPGSDAASASSGPPPATGAAGPAAGDRRVGPAARA